MGSEEPMTYRQIKEYADIEGWSFDVGGFERDLVERGVAPSAYTSDDPIPWGVNRWLTHEVLPAIHRKGSYEWPENLDVTCEFTVLQTGRYVTEPTDERR